MMDWIVSDSEVRGVANDHLEYGTRAFIASIRYIREAPAHRKTRNRTCLEFHRSGAPKDSAPSLHAVRSNRQALDYSLVLETSRSGQHGKQLAIVSRAKLLALPPSH